LEKLFLVQNHNGLLRVKREPRGGLGRNSKRIFASKDKKMYLQPLTFFIE